MDLVTLSLDSDSGFTISTHWLVVAITFLVVVAYLLIKWKYFNNRYSEFEINEAEIGIGKNKVKIKPNDQDLQIAYQLWVELSTRKIGLPIEKDHDVVVELYNSWYEFFRIARELVKTVPVKKVRANSSTQELIDVSFKILNEALRPHLTMWQARFRSWYQIEQESNPNLSPQELQRAYPKYEELEKDMLRVNEILISYKKLLENLINVK
jgi:hypothetical protein